MEREKQERRVLDYRLLADALVEFNVLRRSVGLYAKDHPVTRGILERTYGFFQKLFEIRSSILLGITKDTLVIDDHKLDPKNPAFRDLAKSLYQRGIAAIEFRAGLTLEDLVIFHELITAKKAGLGNALVELSASRGLMHIGLFPIDVSHFALVEDVSREDKSEETLLDEYAYCLLDGRFPQTEAEGIVLTVAPEKIAHIMNTCLDMHSPETTYDRVAAAYLGGKSSAGQGREAFLRFIALARQLNPVIREELLKRSYTDTNSLTLEHVAEGLSAEDLNTTINFLNEQSSLIPESFRRLIEKMANMKKEGAPLDLFADGSGVVDDIALDREIVTLFGEDPSKHFVSEQYQEELQRMMKGARMKRFALFAEVLEDFNDEYTDRVMMEIICELLEFEPMEKGECLTLLSRISEMVEAFLETGRFEHVTTIYNTLYSHTFSGRFKEEISSMIQYYFHTEPFFAKFVNAIKVSGRYDREEVMKLTRLLKQPLIRPLLDALCEEEDASVRKLFLHILSTFKSDLLPEAVRRLNDERWYVVRNMIYLLRECGDSSFTEAVRPFLRSSDQRVSTEALKTMLQFKDPEGISRVRSYLQTTDPELLDRGIKLAGSYRVREVIPELLKLLEKKEGFRVDIPLKQTILRALADIGDPQAVDALSRLYHSRTLFFWKASDVLRVEIFRNLHQYPFASVKPLIESGLRSTNREIRAISEKLLKNKGN